MRRLCCFVAFVLCSFLQAYAQPTCPNNQIINGDLELGIPSQQAEDIDNATGFGELWTEENTGDFYAATMRPMSGFPLPVPQTGNYVGCWINSHVYPTSRFREAFKGSFATPIAQNSGYYDFDLDVAVLSGWGVATVAVYGIYDPNDTIIPRPAYSFIPSNVDLLGPSKTVLLGTIVVDRSQLDENKVSRNIQFNSTILPATGITDFLITGVETPNGGNVYTVFDNFCMASTLTACPSIEEVVVVPVADVNNDGIDDYELTITVQNDDAGKTMDLLPHNCATVLTPSTLVLNGSTTYTVTMTGPACSEFLLNYVSGTPTYPDCRFDQYHIEIPCPLITHIEPRCTTDLNNDGVRDYEFTVTVENDFTGGTIALETRGCLATLWPDTLVLDGSSTYTVIMLGPACTGLWVHANSSTPNHPECRWERYFVIPLRECPMGNNCVCDPAFEFSVSRGFLYSESCTLDYFYPTFLDDQCDEVRWYRNGHFFETTLGNAPASHNHIAVQDTICMLVSRIEADGQRCEYEYCRVIHPALNCNGGGGPGGPPGGGGAIPRLAVSPNPSGDQAQVRWSTDGVSDRLNLRIYNANGVVVQERLSLNGQDGETALDLRRLPAGLYWGELYGEGYRPQPFKLIKQ